MNRYHFDCTDGTFYEADCWSESEARIRFAQICARDNVTGNLTSVEPSPDHLQYLVCECGHIKQHHSPQHGFCLMALDIDLECPCLKYRPKTPTKGLNVLHLLPHSPAVHAGIQVGDVVLRVDGQDINGLEDYIAAVQNRQHSMVCLIERGGKLLTFEVPAGRWIPSEPN